MSLEFCRDILDPWGCSKSRRKKAHKHKLFALVNVRMALGQTAGCPRVNRAKKFMCSPRNTGNINFSVWLTGGLSQGCPDFQKVYVFKVHVPFSCPICSKPQIFAGNRRLESITLGSGPVSTHDDTFLSTVDAEKRRLHILRAARVQNEIAPEKLLDRYEKKQKFVQKSSCAFFVP